MYFVYAEQIFFINIIERQCQSQMAQPKAKEKKVISTSYYKSNNHIN